MCFAGVGYTINSCAFLFWPSYDGLITWLMLLPAFVTHFWLAGWLLVNTPHPAKNRDLFVFSRKDEPIQQPYSCSFDKQQSKSFDQPQPTQSYDQPQPTQSYDQPQQNKFMEPEPQKQQP